MKKSSGKSQRNPHDEPKEEKPSIPTVSSLPPDLIHSILKSLSPSTEGKPNVIIFWPLPEEIINSVLKGLPPTKTALPPPPAAAPASLASSNATTAQILTTAPADVAAASTAKPAKAPSGPGFDLRGWFGPDDLRELIFRGVRIFLDKREFAVLLILALLKLTQAGLPCPVKIVGPRFLAGKAILAEFENLQKTTRGLGGIWQSGDPNVVFKLKHRFAKKASAAVRREDPSAKDPELIVKGVRGGYELNVAAEEIQLTLQSYTADRPDYVALQIN